MIMGFLKNVFSFEVYDELKELYSKCNEGESKNKANEKSFISILREIVGQEKWDLTVKTGKEKEFLVNLFKKYEGLEQESNYENLYANYKKTCGAWIDGKRQMSYGYTAKNKCPHWIYLFTHLHKEFDLPACKSLKGINELRRKFSSVDDSAMYMRDLKDIATFYVIYNKMPVVEYDKVLAKLEGALEEAKGGATAQKYKTRTLAISEEIEDYVKTKGENALECIANAIRENPVEYEKAEHNTLINQCIDYVNSILDERDYVLGDTISYENVPNVTKLRELIYKVLSIFTEEENKLFFPNASTLENYVFLRYDIDRFVVDGEIEKNKSEDDLLLRKLFKSFGFFEKNPVAEVLTEEDALRHQKDWEYVADYRQARACLLFVLVEDAVERELDSAEENGEFNVENVFSEINDKLAEYGMRTLNKNETAWNNDVLDWYIHKAVKYIAENGKEIY
jgi:hypothetical protein